MHMEMVPLEYSKYVYIYEVNTLGVFIYEGLNTVLSLQPLKYS